MTEAPQAGIAYPVTLGSTFQRDAEAGSFCLLRYDFKPASAGCFQPGRLEIDPATSKVRRRPRRPAVLEAFFTSLMHTTFYLVPQGANVAAGHRGAA